MKPLIRLSPLLAAALCLIPISSAGAKPQGFDQAVAAYNNHQYAQALSQFQAIGRANPSDAMTHYYTGLCYQYLSQMSAAKQEYAWVSEHSADPALLGNARQALDELSDWSTHREYSGQGNQFLRNGDPTGPASSPQEPDDLSDKKLDRPGRRLGNRGSRRHDTDESGAAKKVHEKEGQGASHKSHNK